MTGSVAVAGQSVTVTVTATVDYLILPGSALRVVDVDGRRRGRRECRRERAAPAAGDRPRSWRRSCSSSACRCVLIVLVGNPWPGRTTLELRRRGGARRRRARRAGVAGLGALRGRRRRRGARPGRRAARHRRARPSGSSPPPPARRGVGLLAQRLVAAALIVLPVAPRVTTAGRRRAATTRRRGPVALVVDARSSPSAPAVSADADRRPRSRSSPATR